MWLQTTMWLLVAVMFGILYGVITGLGVWAGGTGFSYVYIVLAFVFLGFQYLVGPSMVAWTMRVKWVTEQQEPELHRMVAEPAASARPPQPRGGLPHRH